MSDWKNVQYKDGKMRTSEGGGGGGSSTFAGLDDVSFDNLQNGQVAKYNSTTQKWENADESGGGSSSISEDTLYTATSNNTGTYSLSASIDNYDFIAIWYGDWNERNQNINYMIMTVDDINELHNGNLNISIVGYDNRYCFADIHDTTLLMKTIFGHTIIKVRGIKYS